MARIRSIKPEFWRDAKVLKLSEGAMLLFIGSWNFCDDDGRMAWDPEQVQVDLFSSKPHLDPEKLAAELVALKQVVIYEVAGVRYYSVVKWGKHQKIDKRSPSRLPPPPNPAESPRIPPKVNEPPALPPTEGKGRDQGVEGKGEKKEQARQTDRGTRFKPGQVIPADWRAAAVEMRPDLNPEATYAAFSDYWVAKAGQFGVKLDWLATWRNWLRKEAGPRPGASGARGAKPAGAVDFAKGVGANGEF